jgi:hypothetical protein
LCKRHCRPQQEESKWHRRQGTDDDLDGSSITVDPTWLSWNDGVVVNLAQAVYEERAFDCLPVLADALEEAGCTDADILAHCRSVGPHVRGCWVVDLLLLKE